MLGKVGQRLAGTGEDAPPPVSDEERERRAAFLDEAAAMTPYVAVDVGEEVFFVPSGDQGVGRRLFTTRWRSEITVVQRAVARLAEHGLDTAGSTFVDVGANIGTTTVTALRRAGFGAGLAIEPSPENFEVLRLNLAVNDLEEDVRALRVAASDQEGEFVFKTGKTNTGGHRLAGPDSTSTAPAVETVTLDGLVERGELDFDGLGLIWIDTVGHEGKVLGGASRLLEAGVPVVTAVKIGWKESLADIVRLLSEHYTHVVELRYANEPLPAAELGTLVESFERSSDVLAFRR